MKKKMNDETLDALAEMLNIGSGNAATALSQMIKKRIDIKIPSVTLSTIADAQNVFGDSERIVTSVYLQILGDATGVMLFSFDKNEAKKFADLVQGQKPGTTKVLNEMSSSALKEAATILSGSCLNAMAKVLNMKLLISAPGIIEDMGGAIISAVLAETQQNADYALVMNTDLYVVDEKVVAYFFFVPEAKSLNNIVKKLGF